MGKITRPLPVKLIIGIISKEDSLIKTAEADLRKKFGQIEHKSPAFNFNQTDYYKDELGENLKRVFLGFKKLISAENLVKIKHYTNKLEYKYLREKNKRRINIDPGYISVSKLILATTKNFAHRIYAGSGIFEEITLTFTDTSFKAGRWTYPDYRSESYIAFFNEIRNMYKREIENKYGPSQIYRSV